MAQNVRIALVADDKTAPAKKGVDELDRKLDQLATSWKQAGEASDTAGKKMQSSANQSQKSLNNLGSTAKTIGAGIATYFAVDAIVNVGKQIISVTSEFQKFEAVLTNTLGSNVAAQVALQKVSDTAAKTNFSVQELTDSYIKFANRGVKLTQSELTKLTDVANSTGKSFDQLTEAALDAFSGENERLKEFGITAQKTGQTTQFTFKGVTTEVKNTQQAVKDYIISLGDLEGVSGSTAAISQTLGGRISNLGDAMDQLFVTIGNGTSGPLSFFITKLTDYVNFVKNALKTTEQFRNELANVRADKFIESFKKASDAERSIQESSIRSFIQRQTSALKEIEVQREKLRLVRGNGEKLEQLDRVKKDIELSLLTNEKKLELIKVYYKDAAKEADKAEEGLTDKQKKEADKRAKAEMDALIRRREANRAFNDYLLDQIMEQSEAAVKRKEDAEKAATDAEKAANEKEKKLIERMNRENDIIQKSKEVTDEYLLRKDLEKEEKLRAIREETFNVSAQFVNALFEIGRDRNQAALDDLNSKKDAELKRVGDDKQAQAFINAKFDREQAKIKTKQAVADKANALFNVALNTAEGVVRAIAESPKTFGLPFSAFIAASGAIQAAVIAARPIPKYAKGTEYLNGSGGTDTNLIYADTGERIVPKAINREMTGIQNSELPRLAAMYREQPMVRAELREIAKAQRETTAAVRQIRVERTHITERGIQKVVEQGNSKTKVLNEQFSL